jgi:hypothetical protein
LTAICVKLFFDERFIVHDGVVDRFDRSLGDCPGRLGEQEELSVQVDAQMRDTPATTVNRKQRRPGPPCDKARAAEARLAAKRAGLSGIDARLANESVCQGPGRKDQPARTGPARPPATAAVESSAWQWLEANEEPDKAT